MDTVSINKLLDEYKESLTCSGHKDLTEYELGFIHGLEYALAMHGKRPVMYVDKNRTYTKYDTTRFPEYFL